MDNYAKALPWRKRRIRRFSIDQGYCPDGYNSATNSHCGIHMYLCNRWKSNVHPLEKPRKVMESGVSFIVVAVTGCDRKVAKIGVTRQITVFPSLFAPTHLMLPHIIGLNVTKNLPTDQFSGQATTKGLSETSSNKESLTKEGISADHLPYSSRYGQQVACFGNRIVQSHSINKKLLDEILDLARIAIENPGGDEQ